MERIGQKERGSPCRLHRGPGRPVQLGPEEREGLVLDAAERIIAQDGIARASMAAIAREAGMSKRTVYELFGNRETLIAACVRRVRKSLVRPLTPEQADLPLAERLRFLLMPDAALFASTLPLELLRAMLSEARQQPDLARRFRDEAALEVLAVVRDELARARARGEVAIADPDAAARLLRDMAYFNPCEMLLVPDEPPVSHDEAAARLRLAIDVFLNGVAAR